MPEPSTILDDPAQSVPRRLEPIHCEFCECKISHRGRLIAKSDRAKAILALDDDADQLRREVERLKADLARFTTPSGNTPAAAGSRREWNVGEDV